MAPFRSEPGGVHLLVRLTPRANRDAVEGTGRLSDGREAVAARVRALPEDGAANAALCVILARALRVPKSAVSIVAGATARLKEVRIEGDPARLSREIESWPHV